LSNIGLVYEAKGEFDAASKYHEDALKILADYKLAEGKGDVVKGIDRLNALRKKKSERKSQEVASRSCLLT